MSNKQENTKKFYVIGAGFGRTGTSSFKEALEILGMGPSYHMIEVITQGHAKQWAKFAEDPTDLALLDSILAGSGFRSSCDFPGASFWREQLELYPEAKVVLTVRDPEKWYQSCVDTIFHSQADYPGVETGTQLMLKLGVPTPGWSDMLKKVITERSFNGQWDKESIIACYKAHVKNVIDTCPKDKLLVFDVAEGWEPLCEFLEVPVPDVPFPHLNDTKAFQVMMNRLNMVGYAVAGLGMAGAVAGTVAAAVMGSGLLRQLVWA